MLTELEVFVLDCQASGATPRLGSLLELGWTRSGPLEEPTSIEACWILPPAGARIPRAVRELTGWSESCLSGSIPAEAAWARILDEVARMGRSPVPCVIHYARFERGFLEDLHARCGSGPFPLDIVCLHEVARRLFPELPRRNLRALAGYLGHSPQLTRRSAGHVDASAFIWRAVLPALSSAAIRTWDELKAWTTGKAPPRTKRSYPLGADRRRALPERPGVYRFLRSNGDVLYVGKAANLKRRVAGHFTRGGASTERALEMLTQAHAVDVTPVRTALEAALLESDEIKRLHPPYNVQLRHDDRCAWFAGDDLADAVPRPDPEHRVGPLPSARALASMQALRRLAAGASSTEVRTRATALGVPASFAPEPELFAQAWDGFRAEHLGAYARNPWFALLRASRRLALTGVVDEGSEDEPPDGWTPERIRRHLDRALLRGGRLLRRARWLVLLSEATVVFRERSGSGFRCLVLDRAEIVHRDDVEGPARVPAASDVRAWIDRLGSFDAARYDRLRVLATELSRVRSEGGAVRVRIGARSIDDRGVDLLGW